MVIDFSLPEINNPDPQIWYYEISRFQVIMQDTQLVNVDESTHQLWSANKKNMLVSMTYYRYD